MPPSPDVEDKHNSDNEDDDMIPGTPPSKKVGLSIAILIKLIMVTSMRLCFRFK